MQPLLPVGLTSTTTKLSVKGKTSNPIMKLPFSPSNSTPHSFFFFNLTTLSTFTTSSTFSMIFSGDSADTNRSPFSADSSNNPERSKPDENDIISNAFREEPALSSLSCLMSNCSS
ncbi:hypothetical protein CsSME_00041280 [Camellia sinensis var. sinensis]